MHVIFVLTFCLFVVKNFYVLEFNNCVCKFNKGKNKNLKIKQIKIPCKYCWFCMKENHNVLSALLFRRSHRGAPCVKGALGILDMKRQIH